MPEDGVLSGCLAEVDAMLEFQPEPDGTMLEPKPVYTPDDPAVGNGGILVPELDAAPAVLLAGGEAVLDEEVSVVGVDSTLGIGRLVLKAGMPPPVIVIGKAVTVVT